MDLTSAEMEMTMDNNRNRNKRDRVCRDEDVRNMDYKLKQIKETNETLKQKIHDAKRTELLYKNMMEEMNSQMHASQNENEIAERTRDLKIRSGQDLIIKPLKKQLSSLQQEYDELQAITSNEIQELKEKIKLESSGTEQANLDMSDSIDIDKCLEENDNLKRRLDSNIEIIKVKSAEVKDLEDKVAHLSIVLEQEKEKKECIMQESNSALNNLKMLDEELKVIENQMQSLTSQPLAHGSRGNGLFAELEDKRIFVTQKTKQLSQACDETSQAVARSCSQLKQLRADHLKSIKTLNKLESDDIETDDSLISKIKNLEKIYQELESTVNESLCIADPNETVNNIRYISHVIQKPWNEVKKVRTELNKYSDEKLKLAESIYLTKMQLNQIKKSIFLEELKNEQLSQQIEDRKNSMLSISSHQEESTSDKPNVNEKILNEPEKENMETPVYKPNDVNKPDKGRRNYKLVIHKPKIVNMSDFDD